VICSPGSTNRFSFTSRIRFAAAQKSAREGSRTMIRKMKTSLVLKRDPSTWWRRSMRSLMRLRGRRNSSATTSRLMMMTRTPRTMRSVSRLSLSSPACLRT